MNKQTYNYIDEVIYSKTLPNGLKVFLLPKKEMSKTYGLFSTNYGSIDQTFIPIGENETVTVPEGVAHFLEHKLFEKEDRDVFADFGKQGASANAYTSFTETAYLFSATSNINKNVETLIDFVQDPYFSEESVEKEKGIIDQEILMYNDRPDWQSFMGTIKGMFQNHPVQVDIAGTVESINTITKDDLYMCYNTFYHPANMTLFIAGNFDVDNMFELIKTNQAEKTFQAATEVTRVFPEEPEAVAEKNSIIHMPVSIPRCTVGIKECVTELAATEFLKRDLLQGLLLNHYYSTAGQFYQELYQEKLIDTSFYYSTSLERNFGYSILGTNTHRPEDFSRKVKEQLLSTKTATFNEEELEIMKNKRIGRLLRSKNSLEFIASQYIHYDRVGVDFFEIIPMIQSLTVTDIHEFLSEWIDEDRLSVCTVQSE